MKRREFIAALGASTTRQVKDLEDAARQIGLQLLILHVSDDRALEAAFSTMQEKQAGGLVIVAEPFILSRLKPIAELALKHNLPAISVNREFGTFGGLMSYGGDILENHYRAGGYVARILKGEKPGDLPVAQATKVELIVNLKTAKAIGLTLPMSLLGRADEIIE
jgi:putative tryptophan/tyrosine transport system substrate-binding protein